MKIKNFLLSFVVVAFSSISLSAGCPPNPNCQSVTKCNIPHSKNVKCTSSCGGIKCNIKVGGSSSSSTHADGGKCDCFKDTSGNCNAKCPNAK